MRNNSVGYHLITDTHLGHDMIWKKGYRVEGFEGTILKNVSNLPEQDILVHLGDVSFYNNAYWHEGFLEICPCKSKILVLGNHDRESLTWYYARGWDFVCEKFILNIYGYRILFSHRPIDASEQMGSSIDINIHGHLHSGTHRPHEAEDFHELISIEDTFSSISLKHIVERYERKIKNAEG